MYQNQMEEFVNWDKNITVFFFAPNYKGIYKGLFSEWV